jgi:hypothetical protein
MPRILPFYAFEHAFLAELSANLGEQRAVGAHEAEVVRRLC